MKKFAVLMLCLALLLCACSAQEAPETTGAAEPTQTAASTAPTALATTEASAETEAVTEPVNTKLEQAKTCIDKSVEELYALIGEPESSDYAPSCLGDGEDGNLYYDGFTVYTYKEGDTETVRYVE